MVVQAEEDLKRGWDHLKTIASTLENLRGDASLAFELIQNADDAQGSSSLTFRFSRDALEVVDDGGFRRCDRLKDDECPLERDGGRPCDFHAFRRLGGATKASDPESTGAFGIGFLAVYQVTDRPEVLSAGVHWEIDEENERVRPCAGGCGRRHVRNGTEIVLPWASRKTRMRRELDASVVTAKDHRRLFRAFVAAMPEAMIFLRRLQRIDVIAEDGTTSTFRRAEGDGTVTITGPSNSTTTWHLLDGSFQQAAEPLRDRARRLARRPADTRVALRDGGQVNGRLYATLPTQVLTGLPFHIDATFFPRIDRKGILLDGDYAEQWNRAALAAAGAALADNVRGVSRILGPQPFWQFVKTCSQLARSGDREHKALAPIWDALLPALPDAEVMWTTGQSWRAVRDTVTAPARGPVGGLLEQLGVPTVARDIRVLVPRTLNVGQIDLQRLVDALERLDIDDEMPAGQAPPPLNAEDGRQALRDLLEELVPQDVERLDDDVRSAIKALPIWADVHGNLTTFDAGYVAEPDTVAAFDALASHPMVIWPRTARSTDRLWRIADRFEDRQALAAARSAQGLSQAQALRILRWFARRVDRLSDEQIAQLREARIVPTSAGLRSAAETVRSGGFRDILGATGVLEAPAGARLDKLLGRLGIEQLTFADYLRDHVPGAVRAGRANNDRLVELIRECGRHADVIDDPAIQTALRGLRWVPCRDGSRRAPADSYFDTAAVKAVLGREDKIIARAIKRDTAAGQVLHRLRVADLPRADDIVERVSDLSAQDRNRQSMAAVRAVLDHVATRVNEIDGGPLEELRDYEWLPAENRNDWSAPGDLYLTVDRRLFATSGTFLALKAPEQARLRGALEALGVSASPTVRLVVQHVENLAREGRAATPQVLRWLDVHADDPAIEALTSVPFLPDRDGRLCRPRDIFTDVHVLVPRLAVLAASARRYTRLLEAVDVSARPSGEDGLRVLTDIAAAADDRPVDEATDKFVNGCWRLLTLDDTDGLDELAELPVVVADDGCLYRPADVVLEDTSVRKQLSSSAVQRLVKLSQTTAPALERAGVRRLSALLHAEVQGQRRVRRDRDIEQTLLERRTHLARVVAGERGSWADVLRFIQRVKVRAIDRLELRYSIVGLEGVDDGPVIERDAHYDAETGDLFVRTAGSRARWEAIAYTIKDALLPASGPSPKLALRAVLRAPTAEEADGELDELGYPPLTEATWEEFERVAKERAAREAADRTDGNHSDDDEEAGDDTDADEDQDEDDDTDDDGVEDDYDEDEQADDDEDEQADDDDEDADDDQDDDADNDGDEDEDADDDEHADDGEGDGTGRRRRGSGQRGHGTRSRRRQSGDGSSGNGDHQRRDRHGSNNGQRDPDRRLISYVATATDDASASSSDGRGGQRSVTGEAGVDLVVAYLNRHLPPAAATVRKMPDGQKGFDVIVCDAADKPVRYIEVKTVTERWGAQGVGLSRAQYDLSEEVRDQFWLYVVEYVYEPDARIWAIRNPAAQVGQFFFDHGWQAVAEDKEWVPGAPPPPET